MIDLDTLEVGAVVRLVSGSPHMTVTGFAMSPGGPPGRGKVEPKRIAAKLLLWNDRQGFVRIELQPELLAPPRKRPVPVEGAAEGEES